MIFLFINLFMNYLLKPLLNTALEKYFANIGPDMNLSMFSGQIEL